MVYTEPEIEFNYKESTLRIERSVDCTNQWSLLTVANLRPSTRMTFNMKVPEKQRPQVIENSQRRRGAITTLEHLLDAQRSLPVPHELLRRTL
jgi:hypothetical protein